MEDYKKKYEEALERARKINNGEGVIAPSGWTSYEAIFPELKESKDDIMRKMAIHAVYSPEAQSCIKSWGINPSDVIAWLEKQGEKKPAWSEDDEDCYNSIIEYLKYSITNGKPETYRSGRLTDWLESLKERYSWKPSDEQMATFWDAICNLNQDGYKWINDMKSLYYDLKKLRKE